MFLEELSKIKTSEDQIINAGNEDEVDVRILMKKTV